MFPSTTAIITGMPLRFIWAAPTLLCLAESADWSTELPLGTVSCPQLFGFQECHCQMLSSPFPQGYNLQWSSGRISEWLRLETTSENCLVNTPTQSRVRHRGVPGAMFRFWISARMETPQPPWETLPVFAREIKHKIKNAKPFLGFKRILQYFKQCLLSCQWKEPGLVLLLLPIRYLHELKRHCHPWAFFSQPELAHLSQPFLTWMVPALKHFHSPSLDLFQYLLVQNWMSSAAPQGWAEQINHLLWLLLVLFYQCMLLEIFTFSSRAHGLFMFSLASTSTQVLSAELLNLHLLCQRDTGKWKSYQ